MGSPEWTETFRGGTNELVELERQALVKLARAFDIDLTPDQTDRSPSCSRTTSRRSGYMRKA